MPHCICKGFYQPPNCPVHGTITVINASETNPVPLPLPPKFKIGDTIACEPYEVAGWVEEIFESRTQPGKFLIAIKDAEDDHTYYCFEADCEPV